MNYKGYVGTFVYDPETDIFHGEVSHLTDIITFQGRSLDELKEALADSVEDYLDLCARQGKAPQKPLTPTLRGEYDFSTAAKNPYIREADGEESDGF